MSNTYVYNPTRPYCIIHAAEGHWTKDCPDKENINLTQQEAEGSE